MNTLLFMIFAMSCMIIGHIFKVKRWGLFISVYEAPDFPNLLNALAFGHTLNVILPFRIGDGVRFLWAGRRLRNGQGLSLATVLADIYVDIVTVGIIFFAFSIVGKGGLELQKVAHTYMLFFVIGLPITLLCICGRKYIKKTIRFFASLFNSNIELSILYVSYLSIASIKDIVTRINKVRFCILSFGIWISYIVSYICFAEVIRNSGYDYSASRVFTELFGGAKFYNMDRGVAVLWLAYLLVPLCFCWILSISLGLKHTSNLEFRRTLPQLNSSDRLAFLQTYYEDENQDKIKAYIEINQDVVVIEDNSAGSNASTVTVMKQEGSMHFRKYAFNKAGDKLGEQIDWIIIHKEDIPLPIVEEKRVGVNYVTYDMPCYGGTVGLFRYIHSMPVEMSWNVIEHVLNDIKQRVHTKNVTAASFDMIEKYITEKVDEKICLINDSKYISDLEQYDTIVVNGISLPTLHMYKDILSHNYLLDIFKNDRCSDIHGDLTVENIICVTNNNEINSDEYEKNRYVTPCDYYLIDPNTGNIHNSPFLDYAKLLQSLHGNYEFLMMVSVFRISKKSVNYVITRSDAYEKLYNMYSSYLRENFSAEELKSIYFHEIVHWLRLMSYRIKKDERKAVIFYTELLKILYDIKRNIVV